MPPVVSFITIAVAKIGFAQGALAFLQAKFAFTIASWAVTIGGAAAYSSYARNKAQKKMAAAQAAFASRSAPMLRGLGYSMPTPRSVR